MNLIERAKNILATPKTEWEKINSEETTMQQVIMTYVFPMALIPAIAAFIGYGFIGYSVPFFGKVSGINWGVQHAVISLVGSLLGVIITSFVVDALATSFGSEKNINKSTQLVAYSFTPGFVGGVLNIIPSLSMIGALVGLYGIYIMYLGLPQLKKTPEDKTVLYLIVSIAAMFVIYLVVGLIISAVIAAVLGTQLIGGM